MKSNFIKKLITMGLMSITLLATLSIGASAEWKQNSDGQWSYYYNGIQMSNDWLYNQKENKWYHFDSNGIMEKGWVKDSNNNKWYYCNEDGSMATNKTIDGKYKLDSNGVWDGNTINNTTNNINSYNTTNTFTNTGIINNGGVNNNVINNYNNYGINNTNNNINNSNSNNTTSEPLPITIPSTWTKVTNNGYAINNRSPFIYQVKDTFGADEDSILFGIKESLILKTGYDVTEKYYNGHKATCFEYLDITQKGIEKFYSIVIFNNNKMYGFIMCGSSDNYDTDKKDLENVLNTTLVLK